MDLAESDRLCAGCVEALLLDLGFLKWLHPVILHGSVDQGFNCGCLLSSRFPV